MLGPRAQPPTRRASPSSGPASRTRSPAGPRRGPPSAPGPARNNGRWGLAGVQGCWGISGEMNEQVKKRYGHLYMHTHTLLGLRVFVKYV